MSNLGTGEVERALERSLPDLAPAPRGDLLERILRQVAATPQHTTPGARDPGSRTRPGWPSMLVAAAAVLVGIVAGGSVVLLIADRPSGSPPASASPRATGPAASAPSATASAEQSVPATWERIGLPDPAIGMLGGGLPEDVVAFDGEYIAVGSLRVSCVSDITEAPPGCSDALSELTSPESAVVWISQDGRSWELLPHQAAFDFGAMHHVATDGTRIVVTGNRADPPITYGGADGRPVVWVSDDGRTWELVDTGDVVPENIAWTANGFVGARNTDAGPQFFASDDGRTWRATTAAGDQGPGRVEDLAVDGQTVVAVGYHSVVNAEGTLDSSTAAAWRSPDGQSWERAPDQDAFVIGPPSYTHMFAVARAPSQWVALGWAPNDGAYDSGAWTSPDGLRWTRIPALSSPTGQNATAAAMTWTGEGLVATGTISGEGGSVVGMWESTDGTEWDSVSGQPALTDGSPSALIADSGVVLAVGALSTDRDHWVGVVYLARVSGR